MESQNIVEEGRAALIGLLLSIDFWMSIGNGIVLGLLVSSWYSARRLSHPYFNKFERLLRENCQHII